MRAHRSPIKTEESTAAKVVMIIEELYARAIRFVEVIDAAVFGTIARQRRLPPEELSHSRHAQEYPELHVAGFICQTCGHEELVVPVMIYNCAVSRTMRKSICYKLRLRAFFSFLSPYYSCTLIAF